MLLAALVIVVAADDITLPAVACSSNQATTFRFYHPLLFTEPLK
jgi:hypothetical protein